MVIFVVFPLKVFAFSFDLFLHQDSPEGVKLISAAVSVFGPRKIVQELFVHNKEHSHIPDNKVGRELVVAEFMQIFKTTFVPWCLCGSDQSTAARLDLLIALLDDECFSDQWQAVITYAINLEGSATASQFLEPDQIAMLALLLEKARNELNKRKAGEDSRHRPGADAGHWHCELLESTAVALACSPLSAGNSKYQFLWYVNNKL